MPEYDVFELGDLRLQSGITVPNAWLAYQTYGTLAADKSNVVLYPTSYGAQHLDTQWLIAEDGILDPARYFIIIPNMFGNGLSTSPSNIADVLARGRYPLFTHWDNVHAQARLLSEVFGIERIALTYGWSMGAQQALHWGAIFPDRVARILAICGSARTSIHNKVFVDGVRATLTADPAWRDGYFTARPVRGLRAMGRIYAGWALSQAFYRQRIYETIGFASLEDFLVRSWEANFLRRDGDDLVAMLDTWTASDIADNPIHAGDLDAALGAIRARTIIMPSATDLYFTSEDSEDEAARIPNADFRPIPSVWGHRAGNPTDDADDRRFIRKAVDDLFED